MRRSPTSGRPLRRKTERTIERTCNRRLGRAVGLMRRLGGCLDADSEFENARQASGYEPEALVERMGAMVGGVGIDMCLGTAAISRPGDESLNERRTDPVTLVCRTYVHAPEHRVRHREASG